MFAKILKRDVDQPIYTQKRNKRLYGTSMSILYNTGENLQNIQIFLELEPFPTLLGFQIFPLLLHFITLSPATSAYISEKKVWVKNTALHDHWKESGFWYTSRKLTSEHYWRRYGLLVAVMCYWYAFSPCFEERKKINTKSVISWSIYIPRKIPNSCCDKYYHYKYDAKTGACPPSSFGARDN